MCPIDGCMAIHSSKSAPYGNKQPEAAIQDFAWRYMYLLIWSDIYIFRDFIVQKCE